MGLDTSIPLQVRPIQLDNPLDVRAKALTLQQLARQGQMQEMQMQQAEQEQNDRRTLADLYRGSIGPDGHVDHGKFIQGLAQAGMGDRIHGYQKQMEDMEKNAADIGYRKAQTGELNQKLTTAKREQAVKDILAFETPEQARTSLIQHVTAGDIDAQTGSMIHAQIPQDMGAFRNWQLGMATRIMSAKDIAEQRTPKLQALNLGGTEQIVDMNPLTRGAAPTALKRTMTQGEIAADATARRRDDMADARARDIARMQGGMGGGKPSVEVQRQIGGLMTFDKDLNALQDALKSFNPRDPRDQADMTKRARIQSIIKQAQMSYKEAAALGALTSPDIAVIEGILGDATSLRGAAFGSAGIAAKIGEARAGNKRRVQSLQQQYGPAATAGMPPELLPSSSVQPAPAGGAGMPPDVAAILKKHGGH